MQRGAGVRSPGVDEAASRLRVGVDGVARCWWCGDDPLYVRYHDEEWGRPKHDDVRLFEKLCLEGFQSGLSWLTILRKRENFRAAFAGFEPQTVAAYGPADVERLIRERLVLTLNLRSGVRKAWEAWFFST